VPVFRDEIDGLIVVVSDVSVCNDGCVIGTLLVAEILAV
jgi:hypothetical protein